MQDATGTGGPKKRNVALKKPVRGGKMPAAAKKADTSNRSGQPPKNLTTLMLPGGLANAPRPKTTALPARPVGSSPTSYGPTTPKYTKAPTIAGGASSPRPPAAKSPTGAGPVGSGAKVPMGPGMTGTPSPAQKAINDKQKQANSLQSYMDKAGAAVTAELLPQLNELNRQIADMTMRGQKSMIETAARGRDTQADLGELFGRLSNFTGQIQEGEKANMAAVQQQTGDRYAQLQKTIGSNYGSATADANAESARLGLTGTAGAPMAGMRRDQEYLQGLAGVDGANAQASNSRVGAGFDQLMGMMRGNGATEGASRIARSKNDTNRTLADLQFELESGTRGLEGKRGDIEATRGEKVRQLAEALGDKDYARKTEADQMAFERDLATKRFGMEQQQFQQAQIPQEASYLDTLKAAKLEQEIANEKARLDLERKAAQDEAFRRALEASGFGKNGTFWR